MDESQNEQKPVTSRSMIPVVFPPESLNNLLSTSNAIQRLLEQNDQLFNRFSTVKEYFSVLDVSVHTPNEGSDWLESVGVQSAKVFQSTLPMKGVTTAITKPTVSTAFQSTLPMKGVTRRCALPLGLNTFQSTLPMKGVTLIRNPASAIKKFQSTLPMKGVTKAILAIQPVYEVSIHTPNEGSDTDPIINDGVCQ